MNWLHIILVLAGDRLDVSAFAEKQPACLFCSIQTCGAVAGEHEMTLHGYRRARAEGAKAARMPERFTQVALGENGKAVHRDYATA